MENRDWTHPFVDGRRRPTATCRSR
jgi:hypothetical protein